MSDEKPKATTAADIHSAVNQGFGDVTRQLLALASEIAAVRGTLADHGAKLDALRVSPTGMTPRPSSGNAPGAGTGSGMTVKFGRDKGLRLDEVADLTWYRGAIAKSVDDPGKAQYRDRNLDDLAEIDREIARRSGGANQAQQAMHDPPPAFDDAPPVSDDMPF